MFRINFSPEAKSKNKEFNYTKVLTTMREFNRDNRSLDFFKLTDVEKDAFQILAQASLPKGSNVSEVRLKKSPQLSPNFFMAL